MRAGHVTLRSSFLDSCKNCNPFCNGFLFSILNIVSESFWQARRDSNPQHPDLESGALTVRATGLLSFFNPRLLLPCAMCGACKTGSTFLFRVLPIAVFYSLLSYSFCACRARTEARLFLSLTYSTISVITPAPTVLPPSRMANLSSFSIAIGVNSSTLRLMLSPGMTISTPSGSITEPVTSVVLK